MDDVIVAESLTVSYNARRDPQLTAIDVRIGSGITALIGRNGAGKSTLLRTIATIQKVSAGHLTVLGTDLSSGDGEKVRARLGYLPQDFGFVPGFRVREYVAYAAWLKETEPATRNDDVLSAIESVGLTDAQDQRLGRLSGGMLRRAGIAQAIVNRPDLLILDEPTTGLDPEQRIKLRALLRELRQNRCVVFSSHLIEDVSAVADNVIVLDGGRVLFSGSIDNLLARGETGVGDHALERAYTGILASGER